MTSDEHFIFKDVMVPFVSIRVPKIIPFHWTRTGIENFRGTELEWNRKMKIHWDWTGINSCGTGIQFCGTEI